MNNYDVIVVGAGASGIISAITIKKSDKIKVLLIDQDSKIARKVSTAGNGRCNLFNINKYKYFGDTDFVNDVLGDNCSGFVSDLLKNIGINSVIDTSGRAYPSTYQAETVVDALKLALSRANVDIHLNEALLDISTATNGFLVLTSKNKYFCKKLILSMGSNAGVKASTNVLEICDSLNLKNIKFEPALCSVECYDTDIINLSGLRVKASISLDFQHKTDGEILFTDYGISGIATMQLSRFIKNDSVLHIDFRESFGFENLDEDDIFDILENRLNSYPNDNAENLLVGLCNRKIARVLLKRANIYIKDTSFKLIKKDDIIKLVKLICDFDVKVKRSRGLQYAQVAKGGVDTSQINPKTMESSIEGLYLTGEELNVDGDTGGYNLMFAFKSGYNAGSDILKKFTRR